MTILDNIKNIIDTQICRLQQHSLERELSRVELNKLSEIMLILHNYNEELHKHNVKKQSERQAEYDKNHPLPSE